MDNLTNENIELELLMTAIYMKHGYDFRNYTRASIKRRVKALLEKTGLKTISDLQREILYNNDLFSTVIKGMAVSVTEMFRDPSFYKSLRKIIVPEFFQLPFIKIWHAGCATGEEVYSMAILLKEEGLYDKTRIYATDFDEEVIKKAREGVYAADSIDTFTQNYLNAGGRASFSDYYLSRYDFILLEKSLKENILFSNHNLATDGVFGEMDMIVCRNVMIYFNRDLQNQVFTLFRESLCKGGLLCLGAKETIRLSTVSKHFENVSKREKIYRRI